MNTITSDDILGKDIIDADGEIIGVSTIIHIDNKNKQIIGITVDQGFMKPELYIGLEYIKTFGVDSILLKTTPRSKVRGMNVVDNKGRKIGYVDDVVSVGRTNKIKAIIVKTSAVSKSFKIKSKYIKEIGYSAILKDVWKKED